MLEFERKTTRESSLSLVSEFLQVVRMEDSFSKAGSKHVFNREAGVIERCLVGVDRRARRVQDHDRLRYRVGNPAKFAFIVPQFLFGLLKLLNVSACSIPSDNFAGLVAQWLDPDKKPAKHTVVTAKTCFNLT